MDIVNVKIDVFNKWEFCCRGALAIMKADNYISQKSTVNVFKNNEFYLSAFILRI